MQLDPQKICMERTWTVRLEIFFRKNSNTLKIFTVRRVHFYEKVLFQLSLNKHFLLWLPPRVPPLIQLHRVNGYNILYRVALNVRTTNICVF